jgi:transketolase
MRDTFIKELTKLAAADSNVVLITGDLGFGVFDDFSQRFPDQFLNVGVAEQNLMMVSAGMALEGKKIFAYSIGNFPTQRCLEQIRNDICYHDLDVTIIGMGGGFSYGQLGMSHHATEDISIMRALPNMVSIVPSCNSEVKGAMKALKNYNGPVYLRLDKSVVTLESPPIDFEIGKSSLLRKGNSVSLICSGGITEEAMIAAEDLSKEGVESRVISMHTIKPIDEIAIMLASADTGGIITIEENTIIGGLGSAVAEVCLESNYNPSFFCRIGLMDTYSNIVGDQNFLRKYYNMDAAYIKNTVINQMNNSK